MPFVRSLRFALLLLCNPSMVHAADPKPAPKTVTRTFFVSGIECIACVDVVQRTVGSLDGVAEVAMVQNFDAFANITFDPKRISEHEIAQAIVEAPGLHGRPYEPSLRLTIPDYAKPEVAAKVDSVAAKQKTSITLENTDKAKGEFVLHFKPLEEEDKPGAQGWALPQFLTALSAPAPKGAGVKVIVQEEK